MPTGKVKWFDRDRGYGFIAPDESCSPDIFVHVSAVDVLGVETLRPGQALEYESILDHRNQKPQAIRLQLIGAGVR